MLRATDYANAARNINAKGLAPLGGPNIAVEDFHCNLVT